MATIRKKRPRYYRNDDQPVSDERSPRKRRQDGAQEALKNRRRNAKARQAMFPAWLVAALNARHIKGDVTEVNHLLTVLRGGDVLADPAPGEPILNGRFRYLPWVLHADIQDADAKLIEQLNIDVTTFFPGDPQAQEPLHLIPLHVAVLGLRRVAAGDGRALSSGIKALEIAAHDLMKGRGKPTTSLETADAALNCHAAISMLLTYNTLPADVRRLLGRCQNPRCPHDQAYRVGLEASPRWCESGGCRQRVYEADKRKTAARTLKH